MTVHHGGKVGKAAKNLAKKSSSSKLKSNSARILNKHRQEKHK